MSGSGRQPRPGRPLPSEEEADAFFREVARPRSTEARGWRRALRRRARQRTATPAVPVTAPAPAAPVAAPATTSPPGVRTVTRGCLTTAVVVAALCGVVAVVAVLTSSPGEPAPVPDPRVTYVGAPSVLVLQPGTCIEEQPTTVDERVTVVACTDPAARTRLVGPVPLTDRPYRGDALTRAEAVDFCGLSYSDGEANGALVPSRDGWVTNVERTGYCVEYLGGGSATSVGAAP